MSRPAVLLAAAMAATALAGPVRAATAPCWFERGVVVVPAEVAGVAGDFILDTGAPATLLAETQAQGAGYAATALTGDVRIAGRRLRGVAVAVQDLDVRTGLFATPIAGVIGADVLRGHVVDLSFAPCRLALYAPGEAPKLTHAVSLPLTWLSGVPTTAVAASDGPRAISGPMALATGSDTAVRLSDAYAAAPGAARARELYPYGVLRPRLRAVSLAGRIAEQVDAGLIKSPEPALIGEIGAPLLSSWRVRFDFPARRLWLAPKPAASPRRRPGKG